jgi:hypothetical protein
MAKTTSPVTNFYNLKREFYREHPRVEQRTWVIRISIYLKKINRINTNILIFHFKNDIDKFLNLHQVKLSGFAFPKPIFLLEEINFPDFIISELKMQGIHRPTAIQSLTWPALYSGRDIMCIGLPIISRVISVSLPISVLKRLINS